MNRQGQDLAIVCVLAIHALFPSSEVLGQQKTPAANQRDDKYSFKPSRGIKNIEKDLAAVTKLLDQAVLENASDLSIAKLRVAYADAAFQLGRFRGNWNAFYDATDEILEDPTVFLKNLELAMLYRRVVNLQCGQLGKGSEAQFTAIKTALSNVSEAMTLTDFERSYLAAILRRDAHGMADNLGDLESILEWNGPVLEDAKILMTEPRGEELYFAAVEVQMFYLNELGRPKDLFAVYESASKRFAAATSISNDLKLARRGQLIYEQLGFCSAQPDAEESKAVWNDAIEYLSALESYDGEHTRDAQSGEIYIKQGMISFLRGRDLEKSMELLNTIFEKSKTNAELYKSPSAVNHTFGAAYVILWQLARVNDPRAKDVYRQITEYLKIVESTKGFEGLLDVDGFRAILGEVLNKPGSSVD